MMLKKRYFTLLIIVLLSEFSFSQEGLSVYSDYLSDNYYLIHPSMAGAANCGKIRLTGRQQWFDQDDAPMLQTLSFNTSLSERSGVGIIALNDKNGYHSQTGVKLSYAHHLRFSRSDLDLNQLSFGMSVGLIQSRLDETKFGNAPDPIINGGVTQKDSYFNVDIGASYHFLDFFAHVTIKNIVENRRDLYTDMEPDNLRKYLLSSGYIFGNSRKLLYEPSVLFQYTDQTGEKTIDLNMKVYKNVDFGRVWGALSYRRSFDGTEYLNGNKTDEQYLQWITPIVGVNYKNVMISYTYSHLLGDVKFDTGGFHQITIGLDLFCKRDKWDCNCPAVN